MKKIVLSSIFLLLLSCSKESKIESGIKEYVYAKNPNVKGYELLSYDKDIGVNTVGERLTQIYLDNQNMKELYIREKKKMESGQITGTYQSNLVYKGENGGIADCEANMEMIRPYLESKDVLCYYISFEYKTLDEVGNGKHNYERCLLDSNFKPTTLDKEKEKILEKIRK